MKKCTKCNVDKPFTDFRVGKKHKDGYQYYCKECEYGHKPHKKPEVEKECRGCNLVKSIDEFSFVNREKNFRTSKCKKCLNKIRQIKRMQNPKKEALRIRTKELRNKYVSFSIDRYNEMYSNQDGKCKICKKDVKRLSVDHCHKTDIIRGLLCTNCNVGLGNFKDNITFLNTAILYLKETNTDKSNN